MALEAATYIDGLVSTNPLGTDPRSDGDDHIRLIKAALKATFPNVSGAITASHTELNYVAGVTSAIQTQLNTLSSSKASMPAGTVCLFYQASAPTGWTQVTTHNNKALRIVSGVGGGSGGTLAFTSAFAVRPIYGSVGNTTLTIDQIPSHQHAIPSYDPETGSTGLTIGGPNWAGYRYSEWTGGGQPHNHSFTGSDVDFRVQYIDVIMASRN